MLLPLITPTNTNFMKDFPAQNTVNCDLIDAYARACLTTHSLKPYIPIFKASVSDPVIGTGGGASLKAFYYEIFDQVYTWGEFRFGTSSPSSGSGIWSMSLPFPALNAIGIGSNSGTMPLIGTATIWCQATPANRQPANVHLKSSTEVQFSARLNSGAAQTELTHNAPIPWAPQDGLTWNASYQRITA